MSSDKVQIGDVARMAGVSVSTVSRVLNGHSDAIRISVATQALVRQAAMALRYQPNALARGLRTTQTRTVGVIAKDLLHPFAVELLGAVYATCAARGYHLLLGHAQHSRSEGRELSTIMHSDRVDGIMLIGDVFGQVDGRQAQEEMDKLLATHRHVTAIGTRLNGVRAWSIAPDFAQGTDLALEHLVALGHRRIGYVAVDHVPESWEDRQRREAYQRFLDTHDMPRRPDDELAIVSSVEAAEGALRGLMARPDRPTALFVNNDFLALIILNAAIRCGIRVPDDLSVVGFDDISFAALSSPGLTTIHYAIDDMARRAATVLLDRIEGQDQDDPIVRGHLESDGTTIVVRPSLVERESSGPPLGGPLVDQAVGSVSGMVMRATRKT